MDARKLVLSFGGYLRQHFVCLLLDQSELRLLPHTAISVREQTGQLLNRSIGKTLGQYLFYIQDRLAGGGFGGLKAIDAALAVAVPAIHPVGEVKSAVGTKFDV